MHPATYNGVTLPFVRHERPPLYWIGGKQKLKAWIIPTLAPDARVYVEPYAGSAAVLLGLPAPYPVEVLNDLDSDLVNFYRVLQDPRSFRELMRRLVWTPYARAELERACDTLRDPSADEVSRAWAVFVAHNQSIGGARAQSAGKWGRARTWKVADLFATRVAELRSVRERLRRVRIECRDALDVIRAYDDEDAVFYLDPPYHPDTHEGEGLYRVEGGAEHLEALVEVLLGLRGQAVLSGYDHELFAVLERRGWERYGKDWASSTGNAAQDRERRRTEVLWVHRRTRQLTLTSAVPG